MSYTFRGQTLPAHLEESLRAYVETGRPTGGFLEACIKNNLSLACALADEASIEVLPVIANWLYHESPIGCSGSRDAYEYWIKQKRAERKEGK